MSGGRGGGAKIALRQITASFTCGRKGVGRTESRLGFLRKAGDTYLIPLFHTGHESPESPRIDFFLFGGIREVSLYFFHQS